MKTMKLSTLLQNKKLFSKELREGSFIYTLKNNYMIWSINGTFMNVFMVDGDMVSIFNVEAGDYNEVDYTTVSDILTFNVYKRTAYKDLI